MIRLLLAAAAVATGLAQPTVPPLWGGLEPGPYTAGYHADFVFDATRVYGKLRGPRPVLAAIWYPAAEPKGEAMPYREYFTLPALQGGSDFPARLRAFQLDTVSSDLFQKMYGALAPAERAFLDAILLRPTHAYRDAAPASGRFPVVLYHPGAGATDENNSVICEYLATQGYVVVTSAFQTHDAKSAGNRDFEPETSWSDLAFLLAQVRSKPFADLLNTGAFGVGLGGEYLLEWLGRRHPQLGAIGGLDIPLEGPASVKRFAHLDPQSVPVLIAAPATPPPDFSAWHRYVPCRTEAAPAFFRHGDFLLYGWLARVFTGDHATEVRRNYDQLARVLLAFFDANLKGHPAAWQRLLQQPTPEFPLLQHACGGPA